MLPHKVCIYSTVVLELTRLSRPHGQAVIGSLLEAFSKSDFETSQTFLLFLCSSMKIGLLQDKRGELADQLLSKATESKLTKVLAFLINSTLDERKDMSSLIEEVKTEGFKSASITQSVNSASANILDAYVTAKPSTEDRIDLEWDIP